MLATALELAPAAPWLEIRLHPGDLAALADPPLPGGLRLVADPSLAPGDILLIGPAGRIDGRAATRVDALLAGAAVAAGDPDS
ncbi:MAG: hypothetical protein KC620_17230 [Myxococcales bacterium]|nr:hypothetical protein [Myxococcales bacterium]